MTTMKSRPMEPINLGRGLPDERRVAGEQELLTYVETALARAGWSFPRFLLVDYYITLKTQRFVILLGQEGQGKRKLIQIFAETLVGTDSDQVACIQVRPPRAGPRSEQAHFGDLYERFGWMKFVEFLERAAAPQNSGKPYFLSLEDLSPADVETYFELLIRGDRPGEYRLALPGYPADRWPLMPTGLFICGTVNADQRKYRFSDAVLGRLGSIEFTTSLPGPPVGPSVAGVPPVGLQRLMLAPVLRNEEEALSRLHTLLGSLTNNDLAGLQPRPKLAQLLEASNVCLDTRTREYIRRYVANSFDSEGRGLFEPNDPLTNYYMALDFQTACQALLRLRCQAPLAVQAAFEAYVETLFDQAVGDAQLAHAASNEQEVLGDESAAAQRS